MANTEVGSAYISIYANLSKKFGSGIDSAVKSAGKAFAGLAATAAKVTAAAGVAAAGGIAAVGKMALDSYAQYEQLSGGVDKLYDDAADKLRSYAQQAYMTAGMSANQYMEQATSFSAAMISSLGGDQQKAAEMTDVAMRAMSDNVNVFGSNMEDVQNAFQGFAKQNYTMLDNLKLGYGGTKEEMQRLIDDANAYAEANGKAADLSIDSFADIVQAIQYVQESQNIAGTTAKEAATTIEGSLAMVQGAWANLLTEFGKEDGDVAARMQELVDAAKTALFGKLDEDTGEIVGGILPRIETIAGAIAAALPEAVQIVSDAIGELFGSSVQEKFDVIVALVGDATTAISQFAAALSENVDAGAIVTALTDLKAAIDPILDGMGAGDAEKLGESIATIINTTADAISAAAPVIGAVLGEFKDEFDAVSDVVQTFADIIGEYLLPTWEAVAETIGPVVEDVLPKVNTKFQTTSSVIRTVCAGIRAVVSAVFPVVSNVIRTAATLWATTVTTAMTVIRTVVNTATNFIRTSFDRLRTIAGVVRGIFNTVKTAITDPINTAKQAVSDAVTAIKDAISNCHVKFPHIDLPHFSVNGGSPPYGIGGKGTLPSFSVSWYAQGAWFKPNSPVIMAGFGDNRKYDEVALPLSPSNLAKIGAGIVAASGAGGDINITLNYDAGADAAQMVRDIAHGLGGLRRAGAF